MLPGLPVAFATFVCLYSLFLLVRFVTDEEDAVVAVTVLSFAVGVLMIDYIWPWGIF